MLLYVLGGPAFSTVSVLLVAEGCSVDKMYDDIYPSEMLLMLSFKCFSLFHLT
jgi:hypothetical protein